MVRREGGRGEEASVTVFVSLTLPLILSLILALIAGARQNAVRMQVEISMQTAMESVLAGYQKELWTDYGLLFVDTGVGSSEDGIADRVRYYLQQNLQAEDPGILEKSFTGCGVDSAKTLAARGILDGNRRALRQQVYAYMHGVPAAEAVTDLMDRVSLMRDLGSREDTFDREREESDAMTRDLAVTETDPETGEETAVPVEDPGQNVKSFRGLPVLDQVLPEGRMVSGACIDPDRLSARSPVYFQGLEPESSHHLAEAGPLLMVRYIGEKCSDYVTSGGGGSGQTPGLDPGGLLYQKEYILFGQETDRDNLSSAASRLLALREAANGMYLFSSPARKAEAKTAAAAMCTIILTPELTEILTVAILFAWAYVESVSDVRGLLAGSHVPVFKSDETWHTSVWDILSPASVSPAPDTGGGMDYSTYLAVFLYLESEDQEEIRLLDLMESRVRRDSGRQDFQIDRCVDAFRVEASVHSATGYDPTIIRSMGYN